MGPAFLISGANGYLGTNFIRLFHRAADLLPIVRRQVVFEAECRDPILFCGLAQAGLPEGLDPTAATAVLLAGCSRESYLGAIHAGNVESTRVVVEACHRWGIDRVVFISGFGIPDESQSVFFKSKRYAEELVRSSGLNYCILRCSYILGGNDELTPTIRGEALDSGAVSVPGTGRYRINPLHVDDVSKVVWRLGTSHREMRGSYDLLGDEVSIEQLTLDIARQVQSSVVVRHVDIETLIRASLFEPVPQFSLSQVAILVADQVGEATREMCGVQIRSYEKLLATISTRG
jgi:NADH dehydrogenase